MFMLALFLADDAFKDYHSQEELFELELKDPDQPIWELQWDERVRNLPVFPQVRCDGPSDKTLSTNAFTRQLQDLGRRAGYKLPLKPHQIRAEALIKVDGKTCRLLLQRLHAKALQAMGTPTLRGKYSQVIAILEPSQSSTYTRSHSSMAEQTSSEAPTARTFQSFFGA
jgi:hypothetical protein